MPVCLSNTLTPAASKLEASDAKRLWNFINKFMEDPSFRSISLERVQGASDKNVWSGRVTDNVRAILYQDGDTWHIIYVDRHDEAYRWATARRVERHVKTGALQLVVIPEKIGEQLPARTPGVPDIFSAHTDEYLVSLGLPPTWLPLIRQITDEQTLLKVLPDLPEEVAERFLALALGEVVTPPVPLPPQRSPLEHPDSRRRFFVLENNEDLLRMLEAPLATWIAFLHPTQRRLAEGRFNGPLKVTGSAGTGKTVVALHRARHLARQGKQVLVTTFVTTLCNNLERNLQLLCTEDELSRIRVASVHSEALKLLRSKGRTVIPANDDQVEELIRRNAYTGCPLDEDALCLEWRYVVEPQEIRSWDEYRSAARTGRRYALNVKERKAVWRVFEDVYSSLEAGNKLDWAGVFRASRELLTAGAAARPYDAVIVDEVQDLHVPGLRFLAALAGDGPDGLTVVGDAGQRIYTGGLSLRSLGIDVRGRSHTLRINYRTTEQIRRFADRIVPTSDDLDGNQENRKATVSILKGPEPVLKECLDASQQAQFVTTEIRRLLAQGLGLDEIAIFARTWKQLDNLAEFLKAEGIPSRRLDSTAKKSEPAVHTGAMHRAKGLEFKVVFVIDVCAPWVPLTAEVDDQTDPQAQADALERERQLLYVSVTRARDEVFISWTGEPSRFLMK